MTKMLPRFGAGFLALLVGVGCSSRQPPLLTGGAPGTVNTAPTPVFQLRFSEPDAEFISGMIPHHAQAVKISKWAATHGASRAVAVLAERIVVAQQDEIAVMQMWLRDRGRPVPAADATHHVMKMGGTEHAMLMPGMLTDEELAELDRARGVEFDRLYLRYMIKHHEGAVKMVDELMSKPNSAQDEVVQKLQSDIYADQTTEIDRMQKLLAALPPGSDRP